MGGPPRAAEPLTAAPTQDQGRAPLLEAVLRAARAEALRLHTPAHRGRVDAEYGAALGAALALDLTELDETDDLRDPRGAIAEAQALAAAHFGADRTWFLVNGASVGNCAALLAVARTAGPPRKVVVGRDAHVSVVNGLILADLEPVWVPAGWDPDWGVAVPPSAEAYAAALEAHPDAMAVLSTGPSYYGDPADIAGIRAAAGERPLIVDEAHGAHIPRALTAGADLVVHSAHKGLSGPTQGGYLHLRGERIDPERVATALRLLQSTSPNYWILAGLDAARRRAAQVGISPVDAPGRLRAAGLPVRASSDPARILVGFPDGFAAYEALAMRGIVAEAALPGAVLCLAVDLDGAEPGRLVEACREVSSEPAQSRAIVGPPQIPRTEMAPRAAALGPIESVPLASAAGRICAEAACPYPPGIPVLVPGEAIPPEAVSYLRMAAPDLETLAVVGERLAAEVPHHGRRARHPVIEEGL